MWLGQCQLASFLDHRRLVLAYTAWVYCVLRGRVSAKSIETAGASAY